MKTRFLFLTLCIGAALTSFGQDNNKTDKFPDMSRAIGVSFQRFHGLDSRIAGFPQYKELPKATGVIQLGMFSDKKQFVNQVNLSAGSSLSGHRDKRSTNLRYLGAAIDFGYDFIKDERVALYPLVGIGYQRYQARFFRDNSGINFNDVVNSPTLQNNIKSLDLTNGFLNYRLGLGIAAKSVKYQCSIGLQAMYVRSFNDHAWRTSQYQTLANAPEDYLSQIYAGLVFTCKPFAMFKHGRM
ncbi:MAG TPA: hypothetical protein VL307_15070 [Chitinophagaceae bacterium]|nr:hypothetical protein [Chitinophagaceae bacterium]